MESRKVTVYIPSHNYAKYIVQAVNSVLKQKFHDWELIVIDDGSTDDTPKILEKFSAHPKIKVIRQQKKGLNTTNNIALRLARGQYIMRLDADDYLDENALLVLSNILDTHPDVGLVYPDYYRVDERGAIIDIERRKKIGREDRIFDLPAHGACTMIRKSCLLDLGGYNENFFCQDGYDLWIRFLDKYRPYNVNVPLFYYRQHHKSITQDKARILETRHRIKREFVRNRFGKNIPKVLAIIPARKRASLPFEDAMAPLGGKPMAYYTITEALKTRLLDKVAVVSDDRELLSYARKFRGVMAIERPAPLSLPNSRIEPTIAYVLKSLRRHNGYKPDAVMLLYLHSPLRKHTHIERAIDTMIIFNTDSVISVCEDINSYYRHDRNGLRPLAQKRLMRLERDNLYRENGAVYLARSGLVKKGSLLGNRVGHITMLPQESIKVDSEFNFWLADKIIRQWPREKRSRRA
jgi:CMP-N-acetylneuraminic acid synthetase